MASITTLNAFECFWAKFIRYIVPLAHIPAGDASVKNALPADDLDAAEKMVDKTVTIKGRVAQVYVPASNKVNLLNFAGNYKDTVSAAIDEADYAKFPDPAMLKDKDVLITGTVIVFKNHLEVKVTSPDQIKIVDGMTVTPPAQ